MRQRLAIWFLLPCREKGDSHLLAQKVAVTFFAAACLALAWPSLPTARAQITPLVLPADPEALGTRGAKKAPGGPEDARTPAQQAAAEKAAPAAAADAPTAAPG